MEGPFDNEIATSIDPHESTIIDGDVSSLQVDNDDDDDGIEVLEVLSTPATPAKVSLFTYETVRSLSASSGDTFSELPPGVRTISASGETTSELPPGGSSEVVSPKTLKSPYVSSVREEENSRHVEAAVRVRPGTSGPPTSTPVRRVEEIIRGEPDLGISPVQRTSSDASSSAAGGKSRVRFRQQEIVHVDPRQLSVPLVGYEVMEERARFTVFKLHVHNGERDNWFVFRRFTDFSQLQQKLKKLFPMFRLPLPAKRWFRDNYEPDFLDDRMLGLQAFVDSVLCHTDLCNSLPVQEFFCFNDPPGPHDSVEESRAYCEELEEVVYGLKKVARDKDSEIELLRDELALYKSQVEMLTKALSIELLRDELALYKSQVEMLTKALREYNINGASTAVSNNLPSPASSLAECDLTAPEADQSYPLTQSTDTALYKTFPETEQATGQARFLETEAKGNNSASAVVSMAKPGTLQERKDGTKRKSLTKWFSTEK